MRPTGQKWASVAVSQFDKFVINDSEFLQYS